MISVVGHTTTDHLFTVPELVAKNHSTFITAHKVFYGGGAANIAAGIAMLGDRRTRDGSGWRFCRQ